MRRCLPTTRPHPTPRHPSQDLQRRVAFAFLLNIKNRWRNVFQNRGQNAMAYGMNEAFSQVCHAPVSPPLFCCFFSVLRRARWRWW